MSAHKNHKNLSEPKSNSMAGSTRANSGSRLLGYFFGTRDDDASSHVRTSRRRSGSKADLAGQSRGGNRTHSSTAVVARPKSTNECGDCYSHSDSTQHRPHNGMLSLPAPPPQITKVSQVSESSSVMLTQNAQQRARYQWETMRGRPHNEFVAILESRRAELHEMNLATDQAALAEWLELLKERDVIFQHKFKTRMMSHTDVRKPRSFSFLESTASATSSPTLLDTNVSTSNAAGGQHAQRTSSAREQASVLPKSNPVVPVGRTRQRSNSFIVRSSEPPMFRLTLKGNVSGDIPSYNQCQSTTTGGCVDAPLSDDESYRVEHAFDGELPLCLAAGAGTNGRPSTRSSSSQSTPVLALPTTSSSDEDDNVLGIHHRHTPPLVSTTVVVPSPCGSPRREVGRNAEDLARERGFVAVQCPSEETRSTDECKTVSAQAEQYDSDNSESPLPASSSSTSPYSQVSEPGSPATSADEDLHTGTASMSESLVRCMHGGDPRTCKYGSCPTLSTATVGSVLTRATKQHSIVEPPVLATMLQTHPSATIEATSLSVVAVTCIHGFTKDTCKYGNCSSGGNPNSKRSGSGATPTQSKCEHGLDPLTCKYGACPNKVSDKAVFEAMVQEELVKLRLAEGALGGVGGFSDTEGYTSETTMPLLPNVPVGRATSDQLYPSEPAGFVDVGAAASGAAMPTGPPLLGGTLTSGAPLLTASPTGTVSPTVLALTGATRKLTRKRKVKSRTSMSPMVSGRASVGAAGNGSSSKGSAQTQATMPDGPGDGSAKTAPSSPAQCSPAVELDVLAFDATLPVFVPEVPVSERPLSSSDADVISVSEDDTPERTQVLSSEVTLSGTGDHSIIKRSLLSDFNDDIAAGKADWL